MSSSRALPWVLASLLAACSGGTTLREDTTNSSPRLTPSPLAPSSGDVVEAQAATGAVGSAPLVDRAYSDGTAPSGGAPLGDVVPPEGSTPGAGVYAGDPPISDALDACRQPTPGIERVNDANGTMYDTSLLDSSQVFETSGSGEWDDNANYRRFLEVVSSAPVHETVDISNRQFVVVLDEAGRGVGNCPLELTDSAGTSARLTTPASGRVPVFPALYGFEGPVSVTARCSSREASATLSLEAPDDVAIVKLDSPREEQRDEQAELPKTIELAFVLDVTGSMAEEIDAMKGTIDAVATQVVGAGEADVRLALVAYRDYGDSPVFEVNDFTDDLVSFRKTVGALRAQGGNDTPEAVNEAMDLTTRLDWNLDATARVVFVIADAPPHPGEDTSAVRAAAVLACAGIKVFTVATTGQDPTGRFIFRQMSQLSAATHLFLLRRGAASNPECADYEFRTGELHNLVIDRVRGELAALQSDPLDIAGLGSDVDAEVAEALDECAEQASEEAGGEVRAPLLR